MTQGGTLDECRYMARDAVTSTLVLESEHGETSAFASELPEGAGWEWIYPFPKDSVSG